MLNKVVFRANLNLFVCFVCLVSIPGHAVAKQMPDPDLLMSETGLMLLVIDDVPGTMVKAKKLFDGVYKEYREKGVLGPLQTPMTQHIFQQAKDDQPTHWLTKAVDSIATDGTDLEKVWRPIADQLGQDSSLVTLEDEDAVVAAFARLFKGKMFIGEEDRNPYRMSVFGFEYDTNVFDWMQELRLAAQRQRDRHAYENRCTTVAGLEVIHLPNEGWFIFSLNGVAYGISTPDLEEVCKFVEKVLLVERGVVESKPLRSNRSYQRVVKSAFGEGFGKRFCSVSAVDDIGGTPNAACTVFNGQDAAKCSVHDAGNPPDPNTTCSVLRPDGSVQGPKDGLCDNEPPPGGWGGGGPGVYLWPNSSTDVYVQILPPYKRILSSTVLLLVGLTIALRRK